MEECADNIFLLGIFGIVFIVLIVAALISIISPKTWKKIQDNYK